MYQVYVKKAVSELEPALVGSRIGPPLPPPTLNLACKTCLKSERVPCPAGALYGRALATRLYMSTRNLRRVDRRGQQGSAITFIEICQVRLPGPAAAVVIRGMTTTTTTTRSTSPIASTREQLSMMVRGSAWCDLTRRTRAHGTVGQTV
jgi:hypothetical protein